MGKRTLNINDLMNFIESNKNIIFKSESEKKTNEKSTRKIWLFKYFFHEIFICNWKTFSND